ncbi:MAG: uracil-DNA glycosylase family protein [Gemmataceae bacterium]
MRKLELLLAEVRACTVCRGSLPFEPRPVFQMSSDARILIVGQAPGRRAHESGLPFDDVSGDRLRSWLGVDRECFYDPRKIALLPMGFCYPGTGKSGDLPPRPECAATWREKLLAYLPKISLTLLLGQYAIAYHLPRSGKTLTEIVRDWRMNWPRLAPLPHPSPRNNIWLRKNDWFERETIPAIQERVQELLAEGLPNGRRAKIREKPQ